MARMASADMVVLGERRRTRLEAMVARATTAQRVVLRAKIVLAAWRGHSNAAIAAMLGITADTVRKWRHRFVVEGMAGLHDRPRPGRVTQALHPLPQPAPLTELHNEGPACACHLCSSSSGSTILSKPGATRGPDTPKQNR